MTEFPVLMVGGMAVVFGLFLVGIVLIVVAGGAAARRREDGESAVSAGLDPMGGARMDGGASGTAHGGPTSGESLVGAGIVVDSVAAASSHGHHLSHHGGADSAGTHSSGHHGQHDGGMQHGGGQTDYAPPVHHDPGPTTMPSMDASSASHHG